MDSVDLLVFGPHPDDLEIGMGGSVAKHAAMGLRVGLCDLTAGEMGSNGTVDQRLGEAEEARKVLGAAWRTNLHWPDRAIGSSGDHVVDRHRADSPCAAEGDRAAVLVGPSSRPHRGEQRPHRRHLQRWPPPLSRPGRTMEAGDDVLLLHQRIDAAFIRRRRDRTVRNQTARAGVPCEPVQAAIDQRGADASDVASLHGTDREPRCAVRCARGRRFRRRLRHSRAGIASALLRDWRIQKDPPSADKSRP